MTFNGDLENEYGVATNIHKGVVEHRSSENWHGNNFPAGGGA